VAIFFLLQPAPLSAASPLAMRVDVQPTAIAAEGTVMTVEVQLAPSDRGRIGRQARLRVKLTQGTKTTAHILQDIDFDDQGKTRMEYTWPPGRYELGLTVEGLRGTAQGLWVGHIEIPESLDQAPTPPPAEPTVEAPIAEIDAPSVTSGPEAVAPAAAPVVVSAPPPPKSPGTATETAAETASPVTTPVQASSPVYALVLDIDPSDIELAERAADLRSSIDRRFEKLTPIVIQAGDSSPTMALNRALAVLQPASDSRAIIVISDVRRKASRSEWKKITASVQDTKIPVFVIGLWNDEFDPGTRKQFKRLATDSGGRSYLLQPAESPVRALEMLDSVLNANP